MPFKMNIRQNENRFTNSCTGCVTLYVKYEYPGVSLIANVLRDKVT